MGLARAEYYSSGSRRQMSQEKCIAHKHANICKSDEFLKQDTEGKSFTPNI